MSKNSSEIVTLNIGGTLFTCWKSLLTRHPCLFKTIFEQKKLTTFCDSNGNLFFDRSPKIFEFILNSLRQFKYEIILHEYESEEDKFKSFTIKQLREEINYFGLSKLLKISVELPPVPTFYEITTNYFTKKFSFAFSSVKEMGFMNFLKTHKYSIEDFFITSIASLFFIFWILKFFVMTGNITHSTYKIFYPIYFIAVLITFIIILNTMLDSSSMYPYVIGFCVNVAVTFYLSFFFKKFHLLINDVEYYRWTTIAFPILLAGFFGVLVVIYFTLLDIIQRKSIIYRLEDYFFGTLPYPTYYTVFGILSYLDEGGYFTSFWFTFGILIMYIMCGIFIYLNGFRYLPYSTFASKDDNLAGIAAFIGLGFIFYLLNHRLGLLPGWIAFLPIDILMMSVLYLIYHDKI